MARLPHADRNGITEQFAQTLEMFDPKMRQMMATGTKLTPHNVGMGDTAINPMTGDAMYTSPMVKLGMNDVVMPNAVGSSGMVGLGQGQTRMLPQGVPQPPTVINSPFGGSADFLGYDSSLLNFVSQGLNDRRFLQTPLGQAAAKSVLQVLQGQTPDYRRSRQNGPTAPQASGDSGSDTFYLPDGRPVRVSWDNAEDKAELQRKVSSGELLMNPPQK